MVFKSTLTLAAAVPDLTCEFALQWVSPYPDKHPLIPTAFSEDKCRDKGTPTVFDLGFIIWATIRHRTMIKKWTIAEN